MGPEQSHVLGRDPKLQLNFLGLTVHDAQQKNGNRELMAARVVALSSRLFVGAY